MKRKFLLLTLMCLLGGLSSSLMAQTTVITFGEASTADGSSGSLPFTSQVAYSTTQQIFLKSELEAISPNNTIPTGNITKLEYFLTSGTETTTLYGINVYMKNTTQEKFSTSGWEKDFSGDDLVFTGDAPLVNGVLVLDISENPFEYDGKSNIIIYFDVNSSNGTTTRSFKTYSAASYSSLYYRGPSNTGVDANSWKNGTRKGFKNTTRFTFTPSGSSIPTPTTPELNLPANDAENQIKPLLRFNIGKNTTHYQIWMGTTDSNMTDKTDWIETDSETEINKKVSDLISLTYNPATTYYWKVVVKNVSDDITNTSETRRFTTKAITEAPAAATYTKHTDGEICYSYPNLEWEYADEPFEYQLLLGTRRDLRDETFTNTDVEVDWTTASTSGNSYQTSGVGLAVGKHYWQVNVKNPAGTTKGDVYSFEIPGVENISNAEASDTELTWTFDEYATEYRVLLSKPTTDDDPLEVLCNYFKEPQHSTSWLSVPENRKGSYTLPTNLDAGETYYWIVEVRNFADDKIYDNHVYEYDDENKPYKVFVPEVEIYSFVSSALAAAQNSLPKNKTTELNNPTLEWAFNGDATEYKVFLGTNVNNLEEVTGWEPRGTAEVGGIESPKSTGSYKTEGLKAATKYYWRIDVRNDKGKEVQGTDIWWFGTTLPITTVEAVPSNIFPSWDVYGGTNINWDLVGAQSYNVYLGEEKIATKEGGVYTHAILDTDMKLKYNMEEGYNIYVEADFGELGTSMSEAVNVKVSGKSKFSGKVFSNDYYTPLADATVTLTLKTDEFGNEIADATEYTYTYNTNSNGEMFETQNQNGAITQVKEFQFHNGIYEVTVEAEYHEPYTGELTIEHNGENNNLSVILTPDQTVIFKVTLFNETFNKIDVYLENNNWEDAQPGYYNVYLKNGEKITNLGLQYFVVPDNMTTSVYFTYTGWRELGKGSYQFGVAKVEDKVNWSGVRKIDYDVFEVEGDWNTAANWRDGVPTADTAKVYLLAPATISAEEEVTAGTVNIEQGGSLTINGSLTAGEVYNNTQAGNLCINDGGQLFQNNASLEGKFVMNISNDWSASNKGWQFIASPFIDATTASFESTEGDFDLYRYDGSKENEWVNYKNTGDDSGEEPELPEVGGKSEFSFDFEDGTLTGLRAFAGEGSNAPLWAVTNDNYYSNGTNVIYSASYDVNTWMTYASINNYIVTENAYAITAESKLSWYVRHTNYYAASADVYEVVVSEDGETFTQIWSGTAETNVQEQELSLAEYAGKNLYIGFRHYCVDEYGGDALVLDNITLTTGSKTRNSNTRSFDEETFAQGVGYLASYEIQATATLVGTFNAKTSFDYKVSYTADKELANFHLLGNPFTFNMDWSKITAEGLVDGYAVVNNEGGYDYLTSGTINVGDGFFVKANAENPSLSYDHSYVAPVLRGSEKANSINVIASGKAGKDNVVVNFAGQAEGFNKLQNFNDAIATVYVTENGKNYGIANVDENTTEVALNFDAKEMGNYTISLDVNGEFETVTLVDRFTGVETDMLVENEYSFIASNDDNVNRFVIRLANGQEATANSQFVYQSGEELILSIEGSVQIVDMLGRVVYSNEHANGDNRINVGEFNDATYVVRVVNEEGVKVQKVVIY